MVSAVKYFNEERILTNQKVKLQRIILKVLGIPLAVNATDEDLVRMFGTRVRSIEVHGKRLYVGYEEDGQTIMGYAFPVEGPGFWGPISVMAGVDSEAAKILGIEFYRHSETPGLGGRIREEWFQNQFAGLDLGENVKEGKIFRLLPSGSRKAPNELDAITGATQTSIAVEVFLNRELKRYVTELRRSIRKGDKKDA